MEKVILDTNFEQVVSSEAVLLVDFWAPWCGPCRMLSPVIDEIAALYDGRVTVGKCNVDDCPQVSRALRISSIPTLAYFVGGKLVDGSVGLTTKEDIISRLDRILK